MQKAKNIKLLKNNKAGRLILPDSKTLQSFNNEDIVILVQGYRSRLMHVCLKFDGDTGTILFSIGETWKLG